MTLPLIANPFTQFTSLAGAMLNGGKLYIGVEGQDPETDPQAVFWDEDGSIPALQPLDVLGGYVMRLGTPAQAFTGPTFSMRVRDRLGVQVFYKASVSGLLAAALVNYSVAGSGGLTVSGQRLFDSEDINLLAWGAKGDGVTDDLGVINAAHAYAATVNRAVYMPATPGGYLVSGTILARAPMYSSGDNSFLWTNSPTADVIQIVRTGVTLRDFTICSKVVRTAGYHVNIVSETGIKIQGMKFLDWFDGIGMTGNKVVAIKLSELKLNNGIFHSCPGGCGVRVDTTAQSIDIDIDDVLVAADGSSKPAVAVQLTHVGDITLRRISTVQAGRGLDVIPGNGEDAQSVVVTDSYFDTSDTIGVNMAPTGTGVVRQIKFTNVWSCSGSKGFVIGAAGQVLDCQLLGCSGSANSSAGFSLEAPNAKLKIIGGSFAQNAVGFTAVNGAKNFSLTNVTLGEIGQFSGNTTYGVVLGPGCDRFRITNCDFAGNTAGPIFPSVPGGTPGKTWFINDNIGLITRSTSQQLLNSGSVTTIVNHGLDGTPLIEDITLKNITGYGTASQFWATSPTSTQFTINTNANPGVGVSVAWSAAIWGS